jgi:hypothetical protein
MTSNESPGFLQRMLTAVGGALSRGILGKSSQEYLKKFSGSDEYWDRVIAAQLGWPQKQPPKPDPDPEKMLPSLQKDSSPKQQAQMPDPKPEDRATVAGMLVHAGAGNQAGGNTLNLDQAQIEDRWRDDGGQG